MTRENREICKYCDQPDCYTCARVNYIKNELHKCDFLVARDWPWQPITWEIHDKYFLHTTPFQFAVHIDRAVRCNFLIKKYFFVSCKIIDIQIPKGLKLPQDDKLMLSKMVY